MLVYCLNGFNMDAYYQGQKVQIVGGLLNWNPMKNTGYAQVRLPNRQIKTATYQELEIVSTLSEQLVHITPTSVSTFVVKEEILLSTNKTTNNSDSVDNEDENEDESENDKCFINKITRADILYWADRLDGVGQVSLSKILDNRPTNGYSDINQFFALNDNVRFSKEAKKSIELFFFFN